MNTKIPSIGRIVLLTLSAAQARSINDRRARSDGRFEGNTARAGDIRPMLINHVWPQPPTEENPTGIVPESLINGQVFLDGNDTYWATSVHVRDAAEEGHAHWPVRNPGLIPAPVPTEEQNGVVSEPHSPATTGLSFSAALAAVKEGRRVAREGWNGKGIFILLNKGALRPNSLISGGTDTPTLCEGISDKLFEVHEGEGDTRLPNLNMRAATGSTVTGWLASQTDLLAEDWVVLQD